MDDDIADGNQTYDISVGPATSTDTSYDGLNGGTVSVTNNDDDTAAFTVTAANDPLQTTEWGKTASFNVVLNTEPTGNVVIPVTVPDVTEGLVSGDTTAEPAQSLDLTFTPTNWQSAQTVSVVGQDDSDADGDRIYNINVGAPTGASEYTLLSAQSVSVQNADDDVARILIQGADLQTDEDGGTDTFHCVPCQGTDEQCRNQCYFG